MNPEMIWLRTGATDLKQVLLTGRLIRHGEFRYALPREVIHGPTGIDAVVFELVSNQDLVLPSRFKIWATAMRMDLLIPVLISTMTILLYGNQQGWQFSVGTGLLAWFALFSLQIAVNALNDVEDYLRLVDLPGRLGGSGVLQKGWMNAIQLKKMAYIALGLGISLGTLSILESSVTQRTLLFLLGGVGVFGILAYSNRPLGMKYRALGDFFIFGLLGPLLSIGISQSFFSHFDLGAVFLGLGFGFLSWATVHAGHLQGLETDRFRRMSTLAVVLGFKKSRWLLISLILLAYSSFGVGIFLGYLPRNLFFGILFTLPGFYKIGARLFSLSGPLSARLGSLRNEVGLFSLVFGILILLALSFSLSL